MDDRRPVEDALARRAGLLLDEERDGLAAVDDGPAAHGHDAVDTGALRRREGLPDRVGREVGLDPGEGVGQRPPERGAHPLAVLAVGPAGARHEQDPPEAQLPQHDRQLGDGPRAEPQALRGVGLAPASARSRLHPGPVSG